ncbi:hypothetical protein DFQ29_005119 [Apophysomyces sp. BC1021]|nr:hypothetical protein DFQ29_005119 [Apophysomyces sp. BC1021]
MACHCCQITLSAAPDATLGPIKPHASLVDTPTDYNLTLTGPLNTVMAARGDLLSHSPLKINLTLKIPIHDCPSHAALRAQCDKIETDTNTHIVLFEPSPRRSSFISENTLSIVITGLPRYAEQARIQVLTALDEMVGLHSDTLKIPLKLHNLICGRKRVSLQPIIEETATNIYFPSPFRESTEELSDKTDEYSPPIYITGDPVNVNRVKDMFNKLATQKEKSMYHKDSLLHARKLDWMLLHRRDELRKIMHDNGSFIAMPSLGSGNGVVTAYAENRVNAERTLRSLNFLACSIYEACFYFNNRDGAIYGTDGAHTFFNSINNLVGLVSQLSQISGAEVSYKTDPGCIEVFGTERAVRNVYQRLHEMAFLKMFHQDSVFNVELSNDQREFISGKKSGKINKIMKTSGAKIKFLPFSEYNFIIEVESTSFTKALDGLTMLQEELPAEISFFVPETYHKRIIGVGGKNIQRIMKKYGVYVKFSNAEEFAALGGYYDNEDNVVARTPTKNHINLDNLRHSVMELISPRDKDFVVQTAGIPFRMHRILIRDHETHLAEITRQTNTRILWPDHELASDTVTLVGPEAQVGTAVKMLRSIVPEEYHFHAPCSPALRAILASADFKEAVIGRLQREFDIHLDTGIPLKSAPATATSAPVSPTIRTSTAAPAEEDIVIPLKMNKSNLECLPAALDILIGYLKSQHVALYDDIVMKSAKGASHSSSTGSIADTFGPPFGSKMLPSVISSDLTSSSSMLHSGTFSSYSLFDYPASSGSTALDASWKNFRDMNSSRAAENIRAIFDTPLEKDQPDKRMSMPLNTTGFGFRGQSNGHSSGSVDIWSSPPQMPLMPSGFAGGGGGGGGVTTTTTSTLPAGVMDTTKSHSMMYNVEPSTAGLYSSYGIQHKPSAVDFHQYVVPTSSTSTGSNSSMHSTQSMPEGDLRFSQPAMPARRHEDTSPPKATTLSTATQIRASRSSSFVMPHTPSHPPPLVYSAWHLKKENL